MTDAEIRTLIAELAANTKELKEGQKELRTITKELRASNEEMRASNKELQKGDQASRERQDKIDQLMAENTADLKRMLKEYGGFINNQGKQAEEFFIEALRKLELKVADLEFDDITANVSRQRRDGGIELDALLTNGELVAFLEVKTRLHRNDIEDIYHRRIPAFRKFMREFHDKELVVLVAGHSVNADALKRAQDYGFICLKPDHQKLSLVSATYAKF